MFVIPSSEQPDGVGDCYFHSMDEETEASRSEVPCKRRLYLNSFRRLPVKSLVTTAHSSTQPVLWHVCSVIMPETEQKANLHKKENKRCSYKEKAFLPSATNCSSNSVGYFPWGHLSSGRSHLKKFVLCLVNTHGSMSTSLYKQFICKLLRAIPTLFFW